MAAAKRQDRHRQSSRKRRRQRAGLLGEVLLAAVLLAGLLLFVNGHRQPAGNGGRDFEVLAAAWTPAPTASETPAPTEEPAPTPTPTPAPTPTPEPTPAPTPEPPRVQVKYPYAIVVDRGAQIVTVLTVGPSGLYDVVARQMICSTDKYNRKPTDGVYALDGERKRWLTTLTGSYAQYATRISATILFHSVPYTRSSGSALMAKEYYKLGKNVSEGCVRLTCEDAKWIYDNIPSGTLVRFYTGKYDKAKLAALFPPALSGGKWDPTDASSGNPDYIGRSYHLTPVATPYPWVTPMPTTYKLSKWKRPQ